MLACTLRYNENCLESSEKLTDSQFSLPHGTGSDDERTTKLLAQKIKSESLSVDTVPRDVRERAVERICESDARFKDDMQ